MEPCKSASSTASFETTRIRPSVWRPSSSTTYLATSRASRWSRRGAACSKCPPTATWCSRRRPPSGTPPTRRSAPPSPPTSNRPGAPAPIPRRAHPRALLGPGMGRQAEGASGGAASWTIRRRVLVSARRSKGPQVRQLGTPVGLGGPRHPGGGGTWAGGWGRRLGPVRRWPGRPGLP